MLSPMIMPDMLAKPVRPSGTLKRGLQRMLEIGFVGVQALAYGGAIPLSTSIRPSGTLKRGLQRMLEFRL